MGWRDWFRRPPATPPSKARRLVRSVFAAAGQGRLFDDWVASWMSGRDENRYELRLLRNRSREQCRNNPLARRYLGLCEENILGPAGITLQARNRLATGEPDEETNQQIELAWAEWGRREVCTADGRYTWREFQAAVVEAVKRDGEALVELLPGFHNRFGFAVRLLDIDLLDEDHNVPSKQGLTGNTVVQGVELDRWGREVAFHVWSHHPAEPIGVGERRRVRMPAGQLLHLGRPRRVGQVRYEPALAPVLVPMRMLDEYLNAELTASRAAAETPVFIQKSIDAPGPDPDDTAGARIIETSRGTAQELAPGETLADWPGEHPNAVLPSFVREVKAQIAAGLHVAYASLTGDMSQSNYSSSRMALTPERDHWRMEQRWLADSLCDPVYRTWLRQAVVWQAIRLPGPASSYLMASWEPRGFEYVDPEKDISAELIEVEAGLNSLTRVAAGRGRDLRTLLMERKAELALAESLGVTVVTSKPSAAGRPSEATQTPTPEPEAVA
jgi:lambda family phage portal protein